MKISEGIMSCCKGSGVILPSTLDSTLRTNGVSISLDLHAPDVTDSVKGCSHPIIDLVLR